MDPQTFAKIESHAQRLLLDSGIKRPPTLVDPLLVEKHLKLFHFNLPTDNGLPSALKESIRAFIQVSDKQIYVSKKIHKKQQRFASFHEIGHYVLPWHKKFFYQCSEIDLSPRARRIFDEEANAFAAECIFQGGAFTEMALDSRFGMRSVMNLADDFEVSFEAAGRRYVERHPDPCALAVCEPYPYTEDEEATGFRLKYAVRSDTFPAWFRTGSFLSPQHVVSQTCRENHDAPVRHKIILDGANDTMLKCAANIFFNGYNALILIKPQKFKGSGARTPLL